MVTNVSILKRLQSAPSPFSKGDAFLFEKPNGTNALLLYYEDRDSIIPYDATEVSSTLVSNTEIFPGSVSASEGDHQRRFLGGGILDLNLQGGYEYGTFVGDWNSPVYLPNKETNLFWDLVGMLENREVEMSEDASDAMSKFKGREYLEALAQELFPLTGNVGVVPPDVGRWRLDFLVLSASYGCTGMCKDCQFSEGKYASVDDATFDQQLDVYERYVGEDILKRIGIVFGNLQAGREGLRRLNQLADRVDSRWNRNGMVPYLIFTTLDDLLAIKEEEVVNAKRFVMNVGLESGSERIRNIYGKRKLKNEHFIQAYVKMQEYNIPWSVNILCGIDSEDHVDQTVELLKECVDRYGTDNLPDIYLSEYEDRKSIASNMALCFGGNPVPNENTLAAAEPFVRKIREVAGFMVRPYAFFSYSAPR